MTKTTMAECHKFIDAYVNDKDFVPTAHPLAYYPYALMHFNEDPDLYGKFIEMCGQN